MGAPEEQLGLSEMTRSYSRTRTYANFTPGLGPIVPVSLLLLAVKSSVLEHSLLEPLVPFDSFDSFEPFDCDREPTERDLFADDTCETEPS